MESLFPADATLDGTTLVVFGLGLLLLVSLLFVLLILSRRQLGREIRDMVVTLEDLRSGHTRRRAEVDPRSSMAVLADAVNRLAQDISGRFAGAEQAREQLETFLEAARDYGVVSTDADWDIRTFSRGAAELLGWSEDEVRGRPASLMFHDASWKELLPKLARRGLRERGVETRGVMTRRDGTGFHADLLVRELKASGEEASGFIVVVKDITAQVRLEDELRDSETRYRGLVEGLSEGVVIVQDGLIAYANAGVGRMLGAEADALGGRPLRDWIDTRDLLVVEEAVSRLAGVEGGREELRSTLVGHDGSAIRVRLHLTGVRRDGRPATLVSVIDETADQRVLVELRRNESRLDAVLEATSDGVVVLTETPVGRTVGMTNTAFASMFGLDTAQVLGASEHELATLLEAKGDAGGAVAALLREESVGPRREAVPLEGEAARFMEVKTAPLQGTTGERLGQVLACRDLSDQKASERRLEESADELRRNQAELRVSYEKLREAHDDEKRRAERLDRLGGELRKLDEMKSNLLANVSHELQTPLVSIRGYTEMILKGRLGSITEEQRKGLSLSLKNIDRLIGMIDNLLTFARMDREASEINIGSFPLRTVIDESVEMMRDKAERRKLTLNLHLEDPDVVLRADSDKILQVFINLLSNAIKYNREGGRIEIASRRSEGGFLTVQVRDTGEGIPEDSLERIFDRFYQEGPSDSGKDGSGIGLAIVRNILRLHGCTIRVESTLGLGSTFSFTLPLADEAATGTDAAPVRPPESVAPAGPDTTRDGTPAPDDDPDDSPRPRFRVIRRRNS